MQAWARSLAPSAHGYGARTAWGPRGEQGPVTLRSPCPVGRQTGRCSDAVQFRGALGSWNITKREAWMDGGRGGPFLSILSCFFKFVFFFSLWNVLQIHRPRGKSGRKFLKSVQSCRTCAILWSCNTKLERTPKLSKKQT